MCGIAGVMAVGPGAPDGAILDRLQSALAHRGPDGQGRFTDARAGLGLVHTRLAVIDLETGDQPMAGPGGTVLVANGEIYNFLELRDMLGEDIFATRSDCEPVLHLRAAKGDAFPEWLRGMYALALAEPASARLTLARDPFGIKPLYYVEGAGGFAFASEPGALIAAGLAERKLVSERRDELLQLQFTSGADTVFEGIRRVLPGETLRVEAGRIRARSRRAALPPGGPETWSEKKALALLDDALMDSVSVHQRADVDYGMFLSGGIDSSALLACMRDLNENPVTTFTAGFGGADVADERAQAERVAAAAGAHFHPVEFSEADFWALLPAITAHLDDPAADYAVLPTYKLGQVAAGHGIKVVLSGEGGDELFAGYGRYRRMGRPRILGGRPMRARGALEGLDLLRTETPHWRGGLDAAARTAALPGRNRLQTAQATDCADWLPHDLLTKLDRCLMAHGVEGRTPFLDSRLADLALRLPDRLKLRRRLGKWLLRRWLAEKLPEADAMAPKRGFTVPVARWLASEGRRLGPLLAARPAIREICKPGTVERLFASLPPAGGRAGQAAWILLFYALWHRCHIEGVPPEGDVLHCLADGGGSP